MKRALLLYWHGLGDVIMLTPLLRELHKKGYIVDLMCRKAVETSHLLDECPYINKFIIVENPHRSSMGFGAQAQKNINQLNTLGKEYDWVGGSIHYGHMTDKVKRNFDETKISSDNFSLEVYIPKEIEDKALKYIEENYPNGYIFNHTMIEFHEVHNWDSSEWIKENLPNLPIIDTGKSGSHYMKFDDINFSFVLAREAKHRVLSSSVFVHACDAMNVDVEVVNYGRPDRKVWPQNKIIKKIREAKKWIK